MGRDQHLRVNMPKLMFNKIIVPDGLDQIIENSVHHINLESYGRDTDRIPQTMLKATCILTQNSITFYSGINSNSVFSENLHFSIQLADSRIFSHNKILQKLVLFYLRDFCLRNSVAEIAFASSLYEDIEERSMQRILQAIKKRDIKDLKNLQAEIAQKSSIVSNLIIFKPAALKWNRFDEPVKIISVSRKYLLPRTDFSLQAIRNDNHIDLGLSQHNYPPIVLGFYQDDKLVDLRSFDYFAAQPEDWILEVLLEKPRNITQLEEIYNSLFHEMEETYSKIRLEFEEKGFVVQVY